MPLLEQVRKIVASSQIHDLHTHLYDPGFGSLLLQGIDDLLVYPYGQKTRTHQNSTICRAIRRLLAGRRIG